jgi:alpha-amylase
MRPIALLILFLLSTSISGKSKEEWKSRSIYQILTDRFARTSDTGYCNYSQYCGGNYQGIINKLDYIKGMGFDAIWISPIVENTEGSYHGYHLTNLYNLNYHFGSEDDFKALITACHNKDIWVMVDVVANHVGPIGTDYSKITPFNLAEHYHDYCDINDWTNQWQIENCRLSGLPDLKQENDWVTQQLLNWISDLISKYNIDGIRIDTIMEVPKWFWDKFRSSAGVFQIGEAFNGDIGYVSDYQNHLDSVFNYPLYYTIESSFCGSFYNLEGYWFNSRPKYPAPEYTATFVENHDNPRFLNRCNDRGKFTNAVVFSLLWEGVPVFYYGGEQYYSGGADPNNREPLWDNYNTGTELYRILGIVNALRKSVSIWNLNIVQRYADDNFYAFTRGNILACFSNTNSLQRTITYHEFAEGTKLCNVLYNGDCVSVSGGSININMGDYPKVYVKQ